MKTSLLKKTSLLASLTSMFFSLASAQQPSIREVTNEESDRQFRDKSNPTGTSLNLFVGVDVGGAYVQSADTQKESDKVGYHIIPKGILNLGVERVSLDLGGGFAFGEVAGSLDRVEDSAGQLRDVPNATVQIQSGIGEFAARWKFGSSLSGFEMGAVAQGYLSGDSSFALQTATTTNAVFGGVSALYQWNAGALIRLGVQGLADINIFERTVLIGMATLQIGFNVIDPNTKVREKNSLKVREAVKVVEVVKPVDRILLKENVRFLFEEQVVNFEFNKATLTSRSKVFLSKLGQYLLRNNECQDGLYIEGHTDNRGTAEYNFKLSEARANAVKEALVSVGLEGAKLKTHGFGFSKPIDPFNTELAFAKNRRVEVLFLGVREPSKLRELIEILKTEILSIPKSAP